MSPFAMGGNMNAAFDRSTPDSSILGSQVGQMGFGRPLPGQGHQQFDGVGSGRENKDDSRIRNVWKQNLKQEMATLRDLVEEYPYIAMDTEFPGIVARPIGQFTTKADYHYQTLRCNVDLLKMIQLGITLFKPDGSFTSCRLDHLFEASLHVRHSSTLHVAVQFQVLLRIRYVRPGVDSNAPESWDRL